MADVAVEWAAGGRERFRVGLIKVRGGRSYGEFMGDTGLDKGAVWRWEHHVIPQLETALRIAEACGTTVRKMIKDEWSLA